MKLSPERVAELRALLAKARPDGRYRHEWPLIRVELAAMVRENARLRNVIQNADTWLDDLPDDIAAARKCVRQARETLKDSNG